MNYEPVVAGNQSNGNAGTKACNGAEDSSDAGFKPSGEEEKKDAKHLENEDSEMLNIEETRINQEQDANVNSTNIINTTINVVNAAGIEDNAIDENIVIRCADDPNMPNLEEIVYSDEGVGAEADMTNLDTHILMRSLQKDDDDEISNLVDLHMGMLGGGWKWQDLQSLLWWIIIKVCLQQNEC
ncbi:hypothetical protein Tco_1197833 [Tanacetum coccineum]